MEQEKQCFLPESMNTFKSWCTYSQRCNVSVIALCIDIAVQVEVFNDVFTQKGR